MRRYLLSTCLLIILGELQSASSTNQVFQSTRQKRFLGLGAITQYLGFGSSEAKPEETSSPSLIPNHDPQGQIIHLSPEFPVYKIHRYNGIHIKPVSSIPFIQIAETTPTPNKIEKIIQLPSLDHIQNLLGTTSALETIDALKELASTEEGLKLMASFIKNQYPHSDISEADIVSMISSYKINAPAEFTGSTSVPNDFLIQEPKVLYPNLPSKEYGLPLPQIVHNIPSNNFLSLPQLSSHGGESQSVQYIKAPSPALYAKLQPLEYGVPPQPPIYDVPPPPVYGVPPLPPVYGVPPPPPVYGVPPPVYGVPLQPPTYVMSSKSQIRSIFKEKSNALFKPTQSGQLLPKSSSLSSYKQQGQLTPAHKLYKPLTPPSIYGVPPSAYGTLPLVHGASSSSSQLQKPQPLPVENQYSAPPPKIYDLPIIQSQYGRVPTTTVSLSIKNDESIEVSGRNSSQISSESNSQHVIQTITPPTIAYGEPLIEENMILTKVRNESKETYGIPKIDNASSFIVNSKPIVVAEMKHFNNDNKLKQIDSTYGPPLRAPIIDEHTDSSDSNEDNIDTAYGLPPKNSVKLGEQHEGITQHQEYKTPTKGINSMEIENKGFEKYQIPYYQKPASFIVTDAKDNSFKSYTYPGYDPIPIESFEQHKIASNGVTPFLNKSLVIPFSMSPNGVSFDDFENGINSLSGEIKPIKPDEMIAKVWNGSPDLIPPTGVSGEHNYQYSFVPTNEHDKFMVAVEQHYIDVGKKPFDSDGLKVSFENINQDGQNAVAQKYNDPNFSYTQLNRLVPDANGNPSYTQIGEIPLEDSAPFKSVEGQKSSYGELVSSHVFREDHLPAASEKKTTIVTDVKNQSATNLAIERNNKEEYIVTENEKSKSKSGRRRWMPKNKRISENVPQTTIVYAKSVKEGTI